MPTTVYVSVTEAKQNRTFKIFNNIKFFLFCISGYVLFQSLLVSGITSSVITTIEKRFSLKSLESGLIVSSFDFGSLLVVVIVSYFGGHGNRPKWLGSGAVIVALGSFMFTWPHFFSPQYEPSNLNYNSTIDNDGVACAFNSSYLPNVDCEPTMDNSVYIFLFVMANVVVGIGSTPIYTLGNTYLYDNVQKAGSSVYIAIMYFMGALGPAMGYVLGGMTLKIFVEGGTSKLSEVDEQFIGAWWIGYLIASGMVLCFAFPMFCFPKQMNHEETVNHQAESTSSSASIDSDDIIGTSMSFGRKLKDLPKAFASLLCNPVFVFVTASETLEFSNITAFLTFVPKYLQSSFGIAASTAGILTGVILIPSAGSGILLGGYLVKRFSLDVAGCAKVGVISVFLSMVMYFSFFIISCDIPEIIGLEQISTTNHHMLSKTMCDTECWCTSAYEPICYNSKTLYNPCVAGCEFTFPDNATEITAASLNCHCIPPTDTITLGACESMCTDRFAGFMICLFITTLITASAQTPGLMVALKSVRQEERSLAMGVQFVFFRSLAYIPAPLYFGLAIDSACMLWAASDSCDSDDGHCMIYNTSDFRMYYFGLSFGLKAMSLFCITLAWIFARKQNLSKKKKVATDLNVSNMQESSMSADTTTTTVIL